MFSQGIETIIAVSRSVLLVGAFSVACSPSLSLSSDSTTVPSSSTAKKTPTSKTVSTEPALEKPVPENIADLIAIQKRVTAISKKLQDCTVGVRSESSQGSGVIVSADGTILTAAHVVSWLSQDVKIYFNDGRVVPAKVLGTNSALDMALLKIQQKGPWPYAEMSSAKKFKPGQWSLAVGHPGGFEKDRLPVLRLGRLSSVKETILQSDCSLSKGDSGGPLFALDGKIIGIHSRIGSDVNRNFHIPISVYRTAWNSLTQQAQEAKSKSRPSKKTSPQKKPTALLGVYGETTKQGCKIVR
jgi:serine protease Do